MSVTVKFLALIFIIALSLRIFSVYPYNTIVGFDQVRDLFSAYSITADHHLKIIGPTAGNNPNLHHGILFIYFLLIPLAIFKFNPMSAVYFNIFFSSLTVIVLFLLSKNLFKNNLAGFATASIAATSYHFINFAGWLSNPTPTIFAVPTFILGLSYYINGKKWGLILAAFFLGVSIQFELFFIYLIPTLAILFLSLKIPLPNFRTLVFSLIGLCISLSTMIATEIKYHFAGTVSLLTAGKGGGLNGGDLSRFFGRFFETFQYNLWPDSFTIGLGAAILIISLLIFDLIKDKANRRGDIFVLVYLFSPMIMLILGSHDAPWFLIGLPPAICLAAGFAISKARPLGYIFLSLIVAANVYSSLKIPDQGQKLLEPDSSAKLSNQLKVLDYTYQNSNKDKFTINSLTNPLYINAIWAYNYMWYGQEKYRYRPTWSGGDQLPPYNILSKAEGREKYLYLLIDESTRIPISHRLALTNWADESSKLIEEKEFNGILVQKRER